MWLSARPHGHHQEKQGLPALSRPRGGRKSSCPLLGQEAGQGRGVTSANTSSSRSGAGNGSRKNKVFPTLSREHRLSAPRPPMAPLLTTTSKFFWRHPRPSVTSTHLTFPARSSTLGAKQSHSTLPTAAPKHHIVHLPHTIPAP